MAKFNFRNKKKNIPLLLVNGRITKKTFLRWKFFKNFSKKIFEKIDICIASNKETEKYLQILGAKNIRNYGNLKFAKSKTSSNLKLDSNFLTKISERKIWCAASTHPSEEIFCAKTHLELKKTFNNILTVIIPRHINRTDKIADEISKLNLKVVKYTKLQEIKNETDILLIDAYGEALKFYNIAKCVFVGKSLVKSLEQVSGQNPIEPARLGCKIFHGPNVSNFEEVYEYLKYLNVAKEIRDPLELSQLLVEEFTSNKVKNVEIIEKIEKYGENTLADVVKEINVYINAYK